MERDLEAQLFSIVNSLSARKREQLQRLLAQPMGRRAFQRLITTVLDLQNGTADEPPILDIERSRRGVESSERYFEHADPIRQSFSTLLWDKRLFPTTHDVIRAVDHFFNVHLDPTRFRKSGRKTIIAHTWKELLQLSQRERKEKLRRFFSEFDKYLDPHRSYRELFRMLSRSE
jgi:hypothetical protein